MPKRRVIVSLVAAMMLVFAFTSMTSAAGAHRRVNALDDCDSASFDAALQDPNACSKNGGTTFQEFIGQLASMGRAPAWRFAPDRLSLASGGSIDVYNRGGEFHTFTRVAAFGGGCVAELNAVLGLSPVPECANAGVLFGTTGVAPGDELEGAPLAPGSYKFECLIHPWMRTTVTVGG
jgi:plastocyanin